MELEASDTVISLVIYSGSAVSVFLFVIYLLFTASARFAMPPDGLAALLAALAAWRHG